MTAAMESFKIDEPCFPLSALRSPMAESPSVERVSSLQCPLPKIHETLQSIGVSMDK